MDFKMINLAVNSILTSNDMTISKLSNITAAIKQYSENLNWVGFYFYDKNSKSLYLGPFQGKIACPVIDINRGVCGKSARDKKTVVVDDVHKFEDHIACDMDSKSEMVIPVMNKDELYAVLDIDSPVKSRFSELDRKRLEQVVRKVELSIDMKKSFYF